MAVVTVSMCVGLLRDALVRFLVPGVRSLLRILFVAGRDNDVAEVVE